MIILLFMAVKGMITKAEKSTVVSGLLIKKISIT